LKIYSDDPNLPYKTTKLKALYTKSEIDSLFAKWGVKDVYWHWDPEHNDVFAQFMIDEEIEGVTLQVLAKVKAPAIWDHKTRSKAECVNWDISMRVMYFGLSSHICSQPICFRAPRPQRFCLTLQLGTGEDAEGPDYSQN
jgi:hypothetical protein